MPKMEGTYIQGVWPLLANGADRCNEHLYNLDSHAPPLFLSIVTANPRDSRSV